MTSDRHSTPDPEPGGHTSVLVEVDEIVKSFASPAQSRREVRALDGVSLRIRRGETLGLVGESGSGKSTLGRIVLRLLDPDSGAVRFDGVDLATLKPAALRAMRARMQVVFQDPYTSLNRRHSVAQIIEAPLRAHGHRGRKLLRAESARLLDRVQLPASYADRRPAELSGGQAQRVAIARALALSPEFVVLDEAVSALDSSVRAQTLNLLDQLQRELSLTYLFISHDLAVVRHSCHDVVVLHRGVVVEEGSREQLFTAPRDPYTRELLAAVPVPDPRRERERLRAWAGEGAA